jgi:hypothetical protein
MDELHKCLAKGNLNKVAGLMKARLGVLNDQLIDLDSRLTKIEAEDERRRNFIEATDKALAVACLHKAPEMRQ